jgi:hypothetical protein
VIAVKGVELEEMGIEEAAEGLTRLAASEALAERSEELATVGAVLEVKGVVEVETASAEADLAAEIGKVGIGEVAEGAALLGKASVN